ncbi:MAG TPA: ATP-grasp domain-containing protein [Candidatus Fournierella pullicola]|uniref:ATP-grasp domain-containing protein n=1 Tax=Candidatus Allofournierella pullicola TaxID=2838596 RepID=A0A9D2AE55_9FIRM|nr:ATP-grasp domain-containing protein [Candidatus Fournierella pullicola]
MKILVLPGTVWQIPLMRKIKSLGLEVYVANPVKNEEVYQIANGFCQSDIFDFDRILSYCRDNGIRAVMSEECDIATDVVAKLNADLGTRCITPELASLFTNKYQMREFCGVHNICPVPHRLCKNIRETQEAFRELGPCAILKPLDSNASHGVFTIRSSTDIETHFEESMGFSRNSKAVLLEKYISGTEFTVDGIMTPHGHVTLAISQKSHYKHNDNIANSLYFTQRNDKYDYDLLRATNDHLLNTTHLPFGLTHVEYKFCEGKYYLIEMAARGGGNLISAIIAPFMSGVDNYDYLIRSTLTPNYDKKVIADTHNDRTAILKFFDLPCEGGIVTEIRGEEYLRSEPSIKSYKLNFQVGDYIYQPRNDSVRIGYYIICAETKEKFDKVMKEINEKFEIVIKEQVTNT